MFRFLIIIFSVLLFSAVPESSNAETNLERIIREKRASAQRKRARDLQALQHRQANPEAYLAKRVAPAEKSVSFKAARDGHFYVPSKVNGKSLTFLADTGATSIFISQSDARKIGISVNNLTYDRRYQTANGAIGQAAVATAKKFQVGPIILKDVPVTVSQEKNHTALLGIEFFSRVSKYGVEDGALTIHK